MNTIEIKFQNKGDQSGSIAIKPICPDCDYGVMEYDQKQPAWTERGDVVVAPVVCPGCGFETVIYLEIKK